MAARKKREPDPPTQLAELARAMEHGDPPRLVLLRGDERYFRERGIACVRERATELGHDVSTHGTKDPDFDVSRLLGDLAGGSLFAAARCVIVRDAVPLLKKEGKEQGPFVRAVLAFLESDVPGIVVVAADTVRADHALAKAAAKAGVSITCRRLWDSPPPWNPDPRGAELVQWFQRMASAKGLRLSPDQCVYVVAAIGNDLSELEAQAEKLRLGGDRAVQEAVAWSAAGSPFSVADAIVDGDAKRAVGGVHALFRTGFAERSGTRLLDSAGLSALLLSALVRGARQCLAGAEGVLAGDDPVGGAARVGWNLPPRARAGFDARVRARTPDEWRRLLEEVAELEVAGRTGRGLGADDFCHLALRWRRRTPAGAR